MCTVIRHCTDDGDGVAVRNVGFNKSFDAAVYHFSAIGHYDVMITLLPFRRCVPLSGFCVP